MEIVQVLIFMVIIAIAIVQQITKAKKETGTPSPREVLTDMFPTIEETEEEEQTISPRPIKCTPRPIRKKKEKPLSAPIWNGLPLACSSSAIFAISGVTALGVPAGVKPLSPML